MGNTNKKSTLDDTRVSELQKIVDFNAMEIKDWYKEFNETTSGSYMTKSNFHQIYNKMFPGDATNFADEIFRTFDVDGNGKVDFKEFLVGLSVTSCSDLDKKLKWAFDMYDKDGNGVICLEEMEDIIRSVCKMVNAFTNLCQDVEPPEEIAKRIFEELDVDGNNQVTWEEFQKGAKKDQTVVSMLLCDPGLE
ncbi:hypothetical protein ScPMuIL_000857 [Solemya velum]